jgi:enoyl-CoA hydratase/carnithine racemase
MSADPGEVRCEVRGITAHVTFARPRARNAMTWAMYEQLSAALERLDAEADVRVAVLRGAGGCFVAGTDITQFASFATGDDGLAYERRLDAVLARLESVRVPTIAVVEGTAAGGGLALAAACDLRLCTPDARFGVPIAKTVGNCLSMANLARLVMHLGTSRVKSLLWTADFMSADEARARDFVLEIVAPHLLESRIDALCAQLASHAPITLQVTREAIRRIVAAVAASGDDLVHRAYGSHDFHEGVAAFIAKRAPNWEDR